METSATFLETVGEELRKKYHPTEQEIHADRIQKAKKLREAFFEYVIESVEKSVISKRKSFTFNVTDARDVSKLRHIIRRIAKNLGFQIKNMKKRHVIVEKTKFVINVAKKSVNKNESKPNTVTEGEK